QGAEIGGFHRGVAAQPLRQDFAPRIAREILGRKRAPGELTGARFVSRLSATACRNSRRRKAASACAAHFPGLAECLPCSAAFLRGSIAKGVAAPKGIHLPNR